MSALSEQNKTKQNKKKQKQKQTFKLHGIRITLQTVTAIILLHLKLKYELLCPRKRSIYFWLCIIYTKAMTSGYSTVEG